MDTMQAINRRMPRGTQCPRSCLPAIFYDAEAISHINAGHSTVKSGGIEKYWEHAPISMGHAPSTFQYT